MGRKQGSRQAAQQTQASKNALPSHAIQKTESKTPPSPEQVCRACAIRPPAKHKRGLCWKCTKDPSVRGKFVPPGAQNFRSKSRNAERPTNTAPGSEEKISVMTDRAAAGFFVNHPGDFRFDRATAADALADDDPQGAETFETETWVYSRVVLSKRPSANEIIAARLQHAGQPLVESFFRDHVSDRKHT